MESQTSAVNLPPTPPELPVSYSLVKLAFGTGSNNAAWSIYPRRTKLYLQCDPAAYRFRVVWAAETVVDVDISDVRDSKECSLHICSPAMTMKHAGGKQKLYLKFRHPEDYERVVALLERLGVEGRQTGLGPELTGRVGSLQTGVGTPAQFGIESQNHVAMEKQQMMAAPAQIGWTTPSSTYIPTWNTQYPHQRQLQSSQPHSQPDPRNSHDHEFIPSQQSQQSPVTNPFPPPRLISDRPYQDQHQDMLSTPSRQMQFSVVNYPRDPQTWQRGLTALPAPQQDQMSTQQQYDLERSSHQQQRAHMQVQNSERSYELLMLIRSQQYQVVKDSDRQGYPERQDSLQINRMQHPAIYTSSSTLSQPHNFERQYTLPSQAFQPREHTNVTQPHFPTPFTSPLDENGISPPRMPIVLTQRKVPDVPIEELPLFSPLPRRTIVPRPERLPTPEATPVAKKRAPAKPRAKPKPKAATAVASGGGREEQNKEGVAVENLEKPKETTSVLQAKASDVGAKIAGDKAQDGSGQQEDLAAIPKEAKKPARSRAKPKPKPAVVEAEVVGLATEMVGDKAQDKDAEGGGREEENRPAATVTTAKKLAKPRAKPKPKPEVVEAEAADVATGIVSDKAQDQGTEGGGQDKENRPTAADTATKKPAKSRDKPKPKPEVVEAEVPDVATGIVGDKAQDKDTEGGGQEKENRPTTTVTAAKKPARPRAKPKPKAVEAEVPDLATGIIGDKAQDKDTEGGGQEEENRSTATVTTAKKPERPRAKPKPKPEFVEAEVPDVATGIVGDKAQDKDTEGGGQEEENRPAATVTTAKKPAKSRAKPKPKPEVVEAEAADLATGIVGDKAQDKDTEGRGQEKENRPAATVTTAKKRRALPGPAAVVQADENSSVVSGTTGHPFTTSLRFLGNKKRGASLSEGLQSNPSQKRRIVVPSTGIPPPPSSDEEDALSMVTLRGSSIRDEGSPSPTPGVLSGASDPTAAPGVETSHPLAETQSLHPRLDTLMATTRLFQDAAQRLNFENVSEADQNVKIERLISSSLMDPDFARVFRVIIRACQNPNFVRRMM
jgi:hypothetical protein